MPVLIVGADTPTGAAVVSALSDREGELRCFVSDADVAAELKAQSAKVAIGDVSDGSHVGAAGLNCFSMIFITTSATDDRERAFAATPQDVFDQWQEAITMAGAKRVIWVEDAPSIGSGSRIEAPEIAVVSSVGKLDGHVAERVVALDEAANLSSVL